MTFSLIPGLVSSNNDPDGGTATALGIAFTVDTAGYRATSLQFEVPALDWGTTALGNLSNLTTGLSIIANPINLKAFSRTPGQRQTVPCLSEEFNTSDTYCVWYLTQGGYEVFQTTTAFPYVHGPFHAIGGRFRTGGTIADPPNNSTGIAFIADLVATAYVGLTPITMSLTPQAFSPAPGMVTVDLVPASLQLLGRPLSPLVPPSSVQLVPATFVLGARPPVLPATPGRLSASTPVSKLTTKAPVARYATGGINA